MQQDEAAPTTDASHPWFRYYNGTAGDRKLRRVASETGLARVLVLGVWAGLMELANMSPVWGCLLDDDGTPLTVPLMAEDIGIDEATLHSLLEAFERRDMLTRTDGALHLTHWDRRQFQSDSSTERVRRYRERQKEQQEQEQPDTGTAGDGDAKRSGNVTGTDQSQTTETHAETHAETERERDCGADAPGATAPTPTTFQDWQTLLHDAVPKERTAVLMSMFRELYPEADAPEYSYLGGVAKRLGAKRLAELLWQQSTRPPVDDVLAWCQAVAKNGGKGARASPEPGERDYIGGKYGNRVIH